MSDPASSLDSSTPTFHDEIVSSISSTVENDQPNIPTSADNSDLPITSTPHFEPALLPRREHELLLQSTPGGTELWSRTVPTDFKPQIGQFFGTLEEAITFYDVYAEACGFEPRLSSQKRSDSGDILYKFVVCNREGFRDSKRKAIVLNSAEEVEHLPTQPFDIRHTKLTRIGCRAMIEFRRNGTGYNVFQFREWHNHRLCSLRNQEFQKKRRHLHFYHKKTILAHSRVNQGPTQAFRNVKEYVDGYENIGAQLIDFKNFQRDIKCYIGDRDAHMFVNYFEDKVHTTEGFYFAHEVDSNKCLVRAFWTDAESRRNYSLFGDYLSYDPTYSTNKYRMVFTPFTGVDHHKRSVTFGAALLFHENEASFKWAFEKFLDAMGQREPQCIITDQCRGIKKGIRAVFKKARRRYCMWHIMQKVPDKIRSSISRDTDFVSRLNGIVWDAELEPVEFEEKWSQLISEHNLEDNSWLSTMYRKRRKWIPAYFRDLPMGCLLRTTQRSESQNNFFKRFQNIHGTLVEFLFRFKSAIEQQRHTQKRLDRDDAYTLPQLATTLKLEAHASKVYTGAAFEDFKEEASASIGSLSVGGFTPPVNGIEVIGVADATTKKTYQVVYNSTTSDAECSCKLFSRKGLICRHIIWVYSGKQVTSLPDKYILLRWSKNAHNIPLYGLHGEILSDFDATDLRQLEMCKLWSEIYSVVGLLQDMPKEHITDLAATLKQIRLKLNPHVQRMTKEEELQMLLGCSLPTEGRILPPRQAKNKGSGKRMISTKKQCIAKAEKPKRLCRNCKQMAHHDKRNCPNPFVPDADNKGSSDEDADDVA